MTRARRDQRWREQAARLIASAHVHVPDVHADISARYEYIRARRLDREDGRDPRFDVARVRAYCERLIAEADELDQQREVFADWTRARGKGPENGEPYAFTRPAARINDSHACSCAGFARVLTEADIDFANGRSATLDHAPPCRRHRARADDGSLIRNGGWPGNLAREFVSEQRKRRRCSQRDCDGGRVGECDDCAGHGFLTRYVGEGSLTGVEVPGPGFADGVRIKCESCAGTGRGRCHECNPIKVIGQRDRRSSRAFVNGGNMRAAAQRLLDTLDGRCPWATDAEAQPSECPKCSGTGADSWTGPIASMVRSGQPAVPTPGASVTITTPKGCIACNGIGNNLRGVLPRLPAETMRRLHSRQIAMRLRAPAMGTQEAFTAALMAVRNIGDPFVTSTEPGIVDVDWTGTASADAVRDALEHVRPAGVGLRLRGETRL